MTALPLQRIFYADRSQTPPAVRAGDTTHRESWIDVEEFLLPCAQVLASSLFTWGVAEGLTVSAVADAVEVRVSPGVALDGVGRVISVAVGGLAVVDPLVGPDEVVDVPTVEVGAQGVVVGTAGLTGETLLTLRWREVRVEAAPPRFVHAPWLKLVDAAGFEDTGAAVVLAVVSLDGGGRVTALSAGGARGAGRSAGGGGGRRAGAAGPPGGVRGGAGGGAVSGRGAAGPPRRRGGTDCGARGRFAAPGAVGGRGRRRHRDCPAGRQHRHRPGRPAGPAHRARRGQRRSTAAAPGAGSPSPTAPAARSSKPPPPGSAGAGTPRAAPPGCGRAPTGSPSTRAATSASADASTRPG